MDQLEAAVQRKIVSHIPAFKKACRPRVILFMSLLDIYYKFYVSKNSNLAVE
jgi:hypothetical protein